MSVAPAGGLECQDWGKIGNRLAAYAARKLAHSTIAGARPDRSLILQQAADIAEEAIVSVIAGERKWDPDTDLQRFLFDVADSKINHYLTSARNKRERQPPEGFERQVPPGDAPDGRLLYLSLLKDLGGDSEFVAVLDAIYHGCRTPKELSGALGVSSAESVNRLRRLRRKAESLGYLDPEVAR